MRQVIIYPGEDGYWVAECPSLPGCISQGISKEEVIVNIKEAIEGYINALKKDNLNIKDFYMHQNNNQDYNNQN
jgi:predicted RNase H-like HicB family nuclease